MWSYAWVRARKALLMMLARVMSSEGPYMCCRDFLTYDLSVEAGEQPLSFLISFHHADGLHPFKCSTFAWKYLARHAFRSRFTWFLIFRNYWLSPRERARWRAWISSLSVDVIQGGSVKCTLRDWMGRIWSNPVVIICSRNKTFSAHVSKAQVMVHTSTASK